MAEQNKKSLHSAAGIGKTGNDAEYNPENVRALEHSPLNGKKFIFLGSSVTLGMASEGISFVEYLEKRNGIVVTAKDAVSGTTLVKTGKDSYIERMEKNLAAAAGPDLFMCQLSTNDAGLNLPLGCISASMRKKDFDIMTVCGALEYIIVRAKEMWNCPVVFYTNPRYLNEAYKAMVDALLGLREKWGIGVIDLWNDDTFNAIDDAHRRLYMADAIHPLKAGYLQWWTPRMEEYLYTFMKKRTREASL